MNKKTLEQVYSKKINRTLKVIYIVFCLIAVGLVFLGISEEGFDSDKFWAIVFTWAGFEFVRRSFYYITAGDIAPED